MLSVINSLKGAFKQQTVCIDNFVFQLHHKATVCILMASSLLVAGKNYFGDPIDCIHESTIKDEIFDAYCWTHSTFTLPRAYGKEVGTQVIHPGVDKDVPGDEVIRHAYYQWVPFVLFLQAVLFYLPWYLWNIWEGGKLKAISMGLGSPILKPEEERTQKSLLVNYLSANLRHHAGYLVKFTLCEFLNFVNVVGQMFLMNKFLGNTFTTFGIRVLNFMNANDEDRVDPMIFLFPRMTKCTFHIFGVSGSIKKYDGLCILPLNIINEKIYIFLWFWFLFLIALDTIAIVYRVTVIVSPAIRARILKQRAQITNPSVIKEAITACGPGGWFLLCHLCKNIDPVHFKDVMEDLVAEGRYAKTCTPG